MLRSPGRRLVGPALAYRLWVLVPIAAASSLFLTLSEFRAGGWGAARGPASPASVWMQALTLGAFWRRCAPALVAGWAVGAAALALAFAVCERHFRRRAAQGLAGPAVVGIAAPRFVAPSDFTPASRPGSAPSSAATSAPTSSRTIPSPTW